MIIIHAAAAQDSSLLLWGEVPESTRAGDDSDVPARKAQSQKRKSPFDAGEARLLEAIRDSQLMHEHNAKPEQIALTLPTFDGRPGSSNSLIDAEFPHSGHASRAQRWLVTGCFAESASLLRTLLARPSEKMLGHGIMAGEDLLFWRTVASFAASLVIRQKFLPGLAERQNKWHAVWEPLIAGDDLDSLTRIVQAAPGVCFSFLHADDSAQDAFSTVHHYVSAAVDYLVRRNPGTATASSGSAKVVSFPSDTIHDRWLQALHSTDGAMVTNAADIRQLQSDLAKWKRMLNATVNAPFRLCFRLEEPEPLSEEEEEEAGNVVALRLSEDLAVDERPWRISYLLQSSIDPSLYIEAAAVWDDSPDSAIIERTAYSGREVLLASLGAASMIYPPVEASLLTARPSSVEIPVGDAYRFLTEKANLLQEAGFAVMLPSWWTQPANRRRLKASARVKGSQLKSNDGRMSVDALIDFRWDMALGDHLMTREELEELARLKVPLIRLRGQWVEISPEQLQAAIKFLKKNKQSLSLRELLQLNVGAAELPDGIEFDGVTGGGVAEFFESFGESTVRFDELPQPAAFAGQLRPYQLRGYSWMHFLSSWGLGACLADDMGLGKTVQTLALIASDWEACEPDKRRPVLLVCPMSVVGNWQREAQRFTPQLPIGVHHGAGRKKDATFTEFAKQQAIVISSYSLLSKDLEFLKQVPWRAIIIDEAQAIKNPSTNQAQAARVLCADFKLALTGTPVENNVGDLWSIMEFLNPGFLGTQAQFKRNFMLPIQSERNEDSVRKLKGIVGPFILRRLKTDREIISDLPDKLEMKVFCNLTQEQASLYRGVIKEMENQILSAEGIGRKGLVLACMSRLKQVCNHPSQFMHDSSGGISGRSGKLQRLTEMLEEALQGGDCSLIFSQFAEMGELIKTHLQDTFGEEVLFLHGDVSKERRERMVERFQSANGPRLFVLSLKAGGVGLNLTRANQVFHYDRWWNPAVENQATDRAFRIGQKKNVQVHKFVCIGTLEEKIDELIESKQALAQNIVGTGEGWLTELSNDQLKQLFALSRDAVSE